MVGDARERLTAAIECLYLTFGDYTLEWWSGPFCCTSKNDEKMLHSKPLRELTGGDLQLYEWHVFLCGRQDLEGYKHLLPRSLELLANGQSYTGPEVLVSHLRMAGWLDWPAEEKNAVSEYLVSIWHVILSDVTYEIAPEDLLVSMAEAGAGLNLFLETWRQNSSAEAAGRLAEIIIRNSEELTNGELGSAYWVDHTKEMNQVIDWILARTTPEILQPALYEGFTKDFLDYISSANECLRRIYMMHLIKLLNLVVSPPSLNPPNR